MFKSTAQKMQDNLFNLKLAAKQLERNAVKCEKDEKAEKSKLKKAIQKSNLEGARIHAENAIRQKNQSLNYRRMSSRVDAVSQRVQTAATMQQVTKSMGGVVSAMESAMKSMNLEKVTKLMDDFERQFEHLDVQTQVMDEAMQGTTVLNVPEVQVDSLMQEVADEAGLELNMELSSQQVGLPSTAVQEQDDLSARLAQLREQNN